MSNDWYSIWYHNYERTWSITSLPGFFAEGERFLSFWHRQKAVFYVFCFGVLSIYPLNRVNPFFITDRKNRPFGVWKGGNKKSLLWKEAFGDPGGARTLDPLIKSQLLYQLSYGVMMFIRFRIASAKLRQFLKPAKKICVFFKKSAFFVVFLDFSPSCASVLCVFGPKFGLTQIGH